MRGETFRRVVQALPVIAFAIVIVVQGGIVWALGLVALGVVCMRELYEMMRRARPIDIAGFLGLLALCLTALYGEKRQLPVVLVLTVPLTFLLAIARPQRRNVAWGIAATMLGIAWIGLAMAHAVLLRQLPHGGALVVDSLIGTFIGDTSAYFGGRAWGRA